MKSKKIKVPALILMLLLSLLACKKESRSYEYATDVYVKAIVNDGEPVYGLVHFVAGGSAMSSVTVTGPNGYEEQLLPYDEAKLSFYAEPLLALGNYSTTPPTPGTFSYTIKFTDAVEKIGTNVLAPDYLLPATITSIVKLTDNQAVRLAWEAVVGVEYYQLSISKGGTTVYTSQLFIPPTGSTIDIPISLIPGFTPATYTYQLDAIKYESTSSSFIQAVSTATAEIDL